VKTLRPLLLVGALTGFLTGIVLGLLHQSDWPVMLWRSAAAALVLGVLLRWWGQRWTECLRLAQQERFAALLIERQEREEKKPTSAN